MFAESSTYEVYVDYNPTQDSLSQTFEGLSKVTSGLNTANRLLVTSYSQQLDVSIELKNIEVHSILLFLKNVLKNTESSEIKDKGYMAIINQAIIEARNVLLEYVEGHDSIKKDDIPILQKELTHIGQKVDPFAGFSSQLISPSKIINSLEALSPPTELANQKLQVRAAGRDITVNNKFKVPKDQVINLQTEHVEVFKDKLLLIKLKKPDYLGRSQWEFMDKEGRPFHAKIRDEEWLAKFQNGQLPVEDFPFPQDTLKVIGTVTVYKDNQGHIVHKDYDLFTVVGIQKNTLPKNPTFH